MRPYLRANEKPSPGRPSLPDQPVHAPAEGVLEAASTASGYAPLAGQRILTVMPSIPLGGMEGATVGVMGALTAAGATVTVITHREYGSAVRRACENVGCECVAESIDCTLRTPRNPHDLVLMVRRWFKFLYVVFRVYRRIAPDWLYITNTSYFWHSWPLLWFLRKRVVFCLPVPPLSAQSSLRRVITRLAWRYIVVPSCQALVCNSHFTLRCLKRTGASTATARVIHPFPLCRSRRNDDSSPEMNVDRRHVVFLGRIAAEKGVRELVEAAMVLVSEYSDVDFWVFGDHSWNNPFAKGLITRVEVAGMANRIRFPGYAACPEALLSRAYLHVLFSYAEAFGLVVLEAKYAGVPSVVHDAGALPELVQDRVDGYVCGDLDVESLCDGMRYFLDDRGKRDRAGQAAQASLSRFASQELASQWIELLRG